MSDRYILDAEGNPVAEPSLIKWAEWFEGDKRRVAWDERDGIQVSTVFLGIDHSFAAEHCAPTLWETMIFGGEHDQHQERYKSLADALAGHAAAVALAFPEALSVSTPVSQETGTP